MFSKDDAKAIGKIPSNESVSNCANVLSSLPRSKAIVRPLSLPRIEYFLRVRIFINVSSRQDVILHMQTRENISIVSSNWCYFERKCNFFFFIYLVCRSGKLFMPITLMQNKKTS